MRVEPISRSWLLVFGEPFGLRGVANLWAYGQVLIFFDTSVPALILF